LCGKNVGDKVSVGDIRHFDIERPETAEVINCHATSTVVFSNNHQAQLIMFSRPYLTQVIKVVQACTLFRWSRLVQIESPYQGIHAVYARCQMYKVSIFKTQPGPDLGPDLAGLWSQIRPDMVSNPAGCRKKLQHLHNHWYWIFLEMAGCRIRWLLSSESRLTTFCWRGHESDDVMRMMMTEQISVRFIHRPGPDVSDWNAFSATDRK